MKKKISKPFMIAVAVVGVLVMATPIALTLYVEHEREELRTELHEGKAKIADIERAMALPEDR